MYDVRDINSETPRFMKDMKIKIKLHFSNYRQFVYIADVKFSHFNNLHNINKSVDLGETTSQPSSLLHIAHTSIYRV